ncbi:MAG TPA: NAD-dependent dihydropyrimidine dehydrogenase subunit PreA [Pyrinomonadaceae bacterium]|nr:NAD-dependent dihydropyrimidine dehydrogenase subunit PreA [Pyrinomonadaceae bacterium]HLE62020.1 NAD-dependent dihydropyrimidine dehydrogenase subunit PreA [Pyrinomonadaceae bacterium]
MDLSITVNGMNFPNPFLLGSGPPGTNARVITKSYEAGWGGAVAKTISLESAKVVNVVPRYGKLRSRVSGEVIGFENIELISDRPIEVWLDEFRQIKKEYPHHILIASIMEEYSKERWQELTRLVQDTGVDGFELNFSCPHGMTERKMGSEMGEHPDLTEEVTRWVTEVSRIPVWAKMTPNITNIKEPSLAAVRGGAVGISAINTILSVIGVDLKTLRPMPSVEGYTVPGGYSSQAVKPIALRMVSQLALGIPDGVSVSGIGGIERSHDAIEFFLLGASTVQICTGVMLHGVKMIDELKEGLETFLVDKGFTSVQEIIGKSLSYFSTHMELVQKMKAAKRTKAGEASRDNEWAQKDITEKTAELTSN